MFNLDLNLGMGSPLQTLMQSLIYKFTGNTSINYITGTRDIVNEGSGEVNIVLKTGSGVEVDDGFNITFQTPTYVFAIYANDLITGKMVEQVVDAEVSSYVFTHYNPVNNLMVTV